MLKASRSEKEAGDLLSTYLLQGWIMTDEICKVDSCSFPLMRSKDGSLSFCTYHDKLPSNGPAFDYQQKVSPAAFVNPKESQQNAKSNTASFQAPADNSSEEELRIRRERREQSSKASQLIGQKMLQRWALLNDHCPNPRCYAVPLIRNPDTKQMFCVICENFILTEEEASKLEKETKSASQEQDQKKSPQSMEQSSSETTQTKLIHSPVAPQLAEERKRQKLEPASDIPVDLFASNVVLSVLSSKMNQLTERVKECNNALELSKLFKAIRDCAEAIQAYAEASQVYNKSVSI
ncbi:hypothetical protein [Parasitella parasitica]|uniref:Uncharacterized protein n=1 Tax=Parasitella parasitica TaxID=35722 RepID=A0A0B7N4D4_9FUNG|nr:hypothetical protein [Parasitella parasitica]